jgi:hypothetical protein
MSDDVTCQPNNTAYKESRVVYVRILRHQFERNDVSHERALFSHPPHSLFRQAAADPLALSDDNVVPTAYKYSSPEVCQPPKSVI